MSKTILFQLKIDASDASGTIDQIKKRIINLEKEVESIEIGTSIDTKGLQKAKKELSQLKGLQEANSKAMNGFNKGVSKTGQSTNELEKDLMEVLQVVEEINKESIKGPSIDSKNLQAQFTKLEALNSKLSGLGVDIPGLDKLTGFISKLGPAGAAIGVVAAAIGKTAGYVLDVNKEFEQLQGTVQQVTDTTGSALNNITVRTRAISETFDKEFNQVLIAANKISKDFDVSFNDAFDAIETGLLSGADASGDFLDKVKEYPIQFREAGFSLRDFVKLASQEIKGGVYDDKLLDTLKEANISLKELGDTQVEVLENAFGSTFANDFIEGIKNGETTVKDAIIEISKEAEKQNLSLQQSQLLTSDIFKGAGEDVGGFGEIASQVLQGLERDYDSLINKEDEYINRQSLLLEANKDLADSQNTLANLVTDLGISYDGLGAQLKALGNNVLSGVIAEFKSFGSVFSSLINNGDLLSDLVNGRLDQTNIRSKMNVIKKYQINPNEKIIVLPSTMTQSEKSILKGSPIGPLFIDVQGLG